MKLAIADFKEGAEFALYGASRLPAVEAVVENDDPDCAASFLRYYVSELHRRQTCFTALSAETGRLIRKYETYRAVQRRNGVRCPKFCRAFALLMTITSLLLRATQRLPRF